MKMSIVSLNVWLSHFRNISQSAGTEQHKVTFAQKKPKKTAGKSLLQKITIEHFNLFRFYCWLPRIRFRLQFPIVAHRKTEMQFRQRFYTISRYPHTVRMRRNNAHDDNENYVKMVVDIVWYRTQIHECLSVHACYSNNTECIVVRRAGSEPVGRFGRVSCGPYVCVCMLAFSSRVLSFRSLSVQVQFVCHNTNTHTVAQQTTEPVCMYGCE